jgi:hypothetical protein
MIKNLQAHHGRITCMENATDIGETGFFSSSGFHKYKVKSSEPDTNVSGCDAYNVKK